MLSINVVKTLGTNGRLQITYECKYREYIVQKKREKFKWLNYPPLDVLGLHNQQWLENDCVPTRKYDRELEDMKNWGWKY